METRLYKYFSADQDKLERFTNGQVYLTPPKYYNDPWDFMVQSVITREHVIKELASQCGQEEAGQFYDQLASKPEFREDEAQEQQSELSKLIGVVCLTEDHLNRLMWAHYGDSHKGFVAEFRCTEFRHSQSNAQAITTCMSPFGGAMKVKYLPELPLRKTDGSNIMDCFWTKHEDWSYEQEWRVVEELRKADPHPTREGFSLLWFQPSDLVRVILGLRACPKVKFQLKQMLYKREFEHVGKEHAYINPQSRKLDSRPSSW